MSERLVAIVDPVSAGALLAPEIKKAGDRCLAVLSRDPLPPIFDKTLVRDDFEEVLVYAGDIAAMLEMLRARNVEQVIAGSEIAVELGDALSAGLGLATSNGVAPLGCRRNKFEMAAAVARAGLKTPRQSAFTTLDELLEWRRGNLDWPVVLKPVASVASDGFSLCRSEVELARAFAALTSMPNILGVANEAVLLQAHLKGMEYVVDTVSFEGRHQLAAFWRYGRWPQAADEVCYNYMELLPYSGDLQERLLAFALTALDALGIRFGPAHSEIMMVDDRLWLVEVGARMSGGNNPVLSRDCGGPSQLDLTLACYLAPDRLPCLAIRPRQLSRRVAHYFLRPPRPGRLMAVRGVKEIEALPCLQRYSISAKPGMPVPSVAGLVTLLSEGEAALHRDLNRLRELEAGDMYIIESAVQPED